jgi:c-di-GMP-related signal transduction protein
VGLKKMKNEKEIVTQNGCNPLRDILVTRHPIFDKRKEVFAYELLFQSDLEFQERARVQGCIPDNNADSEPVAIDSLFIAGLRKLTGGKLAFISFNRRMLINRLPLLFPSDLLGVELLEDVDPEKQMTKTIEKMKNAGYLVILNDWLFNRGHISLIKLADIIGVDFRSHGLQKRDFYFKDDYTKPRFLAKSVETPSDFDVAVDSGYHFFQGEFFSKPKYISVRSIPSYKTNFMRILKELNKPTVQFDHIESILKRDVSITYKLLRFVNSAAFGLKTTVQSIRQALQLLGETEVRKWLSLIVLSGLGTDKPQELISNTIIRARFCESIAAALNLKNEMPNYFLMGMFSRVDAFLDRPISEILSEIPLHKEVKAAIEGQANSFRYVLNMVIDYENADWQNVTLAAEYLKLNVRQINNLYMEAIEWEKFL